MLRERWVLGRPRREAAHFLTTSWSVGSVRASESCGSSGMKVFSHFGPYPVNPITPEVAPQTAPGSGLGKKL